MQIVDIDAIQGKEFPITIVLITKSLNKNLLYVAITRAQYGLTMISFENDVTNDNIARLIQRNEILLNL
ncbi:ATP-binding domain-containing protein [Helicobacter sp. 23-1045]